ncbi:MAG: UDP-N-acetylmuramate--L-alanine ligase [Phycisphaerae bacterium]
MSSSAGSRRSAVHGIGSTLVISPVAVGPIRRADVEGSKLVAGMNVHMIGVGGCGMCGAAALLQRRGARVSGSDRAASPALRRLAERGVAVHVGQAADNLPATCDLVVYSAAVKEDNPELHAARARGLKVIKYSQLLGILMQEQTGIAIAGTHGKSTTTAMTAFILRHAGLDPSFVIGAEVEQLGGGSGVGDGRHFVVEACEFDRSFHNLRPTIATILNVEEDHLDCYPDLEAIIESFRMFARLIPPDGLLVVNGDDRNAMRAVAGLEAPVETFGFGPQADWRAEVTGVERGCFAFRAWWKGREMAVAKLAIPGRHHVANALAAMAVCHRAGVAPAAVVEALGRFRGAGRRLTERGRVAGVTVVDDYGHHPTEIQVTLRAAREFYSPRRLYVVFQPHQHSRTRFLLRDFASSFGSADVVIVPDIYFVRDSESERDLIDAKDLVGAIHLHGGEARYEPDFARIVSMLCAETAEGDLVITMGAGNVNQIADDLVRCLEKTRRGASAAAG